MKKFDHLDQLSNALCDGVDEVLQKGCPVGGCGFPGRVCEDDEDFDQHDPYVSKGCLQHDLRVAVHPGVMADRVATVAREHQNNLLRQAQQVLLKSGFRGVTITSVEDGPYRVDSPEEIIMDEDSPEALDPWYDSEGMF